MATVGPPSVEPSGRTQWVVLALALLAAIGTSRSGPYSTERLAAAGDTLYIGYRRYEGAKVDCFGISADGGKTWMQKSGTDRVPAAVLQVLHRNLVWPVRVRDPSDPDRWYRITGRR